MSLSSATFCWICLVWFFKRWSDLWAEKLAHSAICSWSVTVLSVGRPLKPAGPQSLTHLVYSAQWPASELRVCRSARPRLIHCTSTAAFAGTSRRGSGRCTRTWVTKYETTPSWPSAFTDVTMAAPLTLGTLLRPFWPTGTPQLTRPIKHSIQWQNQIRPRPPLHRWCFIHMDHHAGAVPVATMGDQFPAGRQNPAEPSRTPVKSTLLNRHLPAWSCYC